MSVRRIALALLACAASDALAVEGIWRCDGRSGVTYQQAPCDTSGALAGIPTDFPPVNIAERERLLAREAALDARLEARRTREVQEAALRAKDVKVVRDVAPIEPSYVVVRAPVRHWRGPRPLTVR